MTFSPHLVVVAKVRLSAKAIGRCVEIERENKNGERINTSDGLRLRKD